MDGTPLDHPDVRLLLDLLAMAPSVRHTGRSEFWADYARAHPRAWSDEFYIMEKLDIWPRMLRERNSWNEVLRLSAYCLMFFDVEKHGKLCVMMDRVASAELSPSEPGAVGRRWLRSINEVAWRLYVMAESQRPRSRE
ncbi:hypothetical protein [Micromonospora sp. NPDC023633]|uniref:hypothetical protein n=1 Tax=Micromonospora sp. NPDC023633 TaxID=3154320 RepID=UPI0034118F52